MRAVLPRSALKGPRNNPSRREPPVGFLVVQPFQGCFSFFACPDPQVSPAATHVAAFQGASKPSLRSAQFQPFPCGIRSSRATVVPLSLHSFYHRYYPIRYLFHWALPNCHLAVLRHWAFWPRPRHSTRPCFCEASGCSGSLNHE